MDLQAAQKVLAQEVQRVRRVYMCFSTYYVLHRSRLRSLSSHTISAQVFWQWIASANVVSLYLPDYEMSEKLFPESFLWSL